MANARIYDQPNFVGSHRTSLIDEAREPICTGFASLESVSSLIPGEQIVAMNGKVYPFVAYDRHYPQSGVATTLIVGLST